MRNETKTALRNGAKLLATSTRTVAPRPRELSTSGLSVPSSPTRPDPSGSWGPTQIAPVAVAGCLDPLSGLGGATGSKPRSRVSFNKTSRVGLISDYPEGTVSGFFNHLRIFRMEHCKKLSAGISSQLSFEKLRVTCTQLR